MGWASAFGKRKEIQMKNATKHSSAVTHGGTEVVLRGGVGNNLVNKSEEHMKIISMTIEHEIQ